MAMTLEEAVANARGYEEQYEREKTLYEMARLNGTNPSSHFELMIEAKVMLEEYYGYDEHHGKWHENKEIDPITGETKKFYTWEAVIHHEGRIAELANEAQRLQERSNLGTRFLDRTFANFDKKRDPEAFSVSVAYANRDDLFSSKKNSLLLMGSPGTGKTHLAAAIANDFVSKGIPTLFGTLIDHLEHIKEEFEHGGVNDYLQSVKTVPILVIDDLGQEKPSEWLMQTLYQIVNYRYEHLLPIVITTNLTADEMANYLGHSMFSRLYEMSNGVETKGSDYRMEHH